MEWYERASEIRDKINLKNKDIGILIKESEANVSRYLKGTLRPDSIRVTNKIAKALNVTPEYLIFGIEKPAQILTIQVNSMNEKNKLNGSADDYRGIPLYESGRLAAGVNGIEFDPYESPASMVVVYKPELQGCAHHSLAAIKVGGDSMSPTITKNSIVVVDLSDKELVAGKVFVVNTPDGGMDMASIKRVHQWEKGFLLLSDNPNYPPNPSNLDWNRLCVGRVVWMWRDIRNI